MILVTGTVQVQPDKLDEAIASGLVHSRRSRGEPGCLSHNLHQDVEDPNRLVFVEYWRDRVALDAHFAVPESGEFVAEVSGLAAEPPSMDIFDAEPTRI